MDILIKNMGMPENCGKCFVGNREICSDKCPLIAIPEHGRLIDADVLEKQINCYTNIDWDKHVRASAGILVALRTVEDTPTVIPASN